MLPFPLPCTPSLEDSHEGWLGEADTATLASELLSSALPDLKTRNVEGRPPPSLRLLAALMPQELEFKCSCETSHVSLMTI